MANTTLKFGNGNWATKEDSALAYSDQYDNFKPLPFDFSRASNATAVNKAGLIETVSNGQPRIDFLGNTQGALLLEPQRTNIIAYSEDFSNSYWAKLNTTVISNASVSPDGTQNADKLNFTTSNGEIVKGMSFVSGQKYTMSFYAKTESGTLDFTYGNMDYGIISGTATTEWQRFEITQTLPTTTRFPKIQTTEIGSLLLWGWQVEQGSYATSYIPTYGATSTRLADQSIIRNLDTNIIPNSGSWTAFFEIELLGNESPQDKIQLSDDSNNPRVYLYASSAGVAGTGWSGGEVLAMNTNNKIVYRANTTQNISFFENGVNEATFSSTSNPLTFNRLNLYGSNGAFRVKKILLYSTALTDSECIVLTQV